MAGLTFSCGRLTAGPTEVLIPINPSSCLRRTTSFTSVLTAAPSFLSVFVGGGRCLNHCPLAHLRLRCYVCLCCRHVRHQILCCSDSLSSNNAPFLVSPVRCLYSDAIEFLLLVHGLSGPPNEPDHHLPHVSSQRRMKARAGPVAFSLRDVPEADFSTIRPHGEAEVLRACRLHQESQIFTDLQPQLNPMVVDCPFHDSPSALLRSSLVSLQFPS